MVLFFVFEGVTDMAWASLTRSWYPLEITSLEVRSVTIFEGGR